MRKLRFFLNKELDKQMVQEFLNMRGGGIDFGAGIIKIHPHLKGAISLENPKQIKKFISVYFDNYYQNNGLEINYNTKLIRNTWRKYELNFVNITEKFFNGFKFPKGYYIAYTSIINCNPRFLELKTFQFFYKKSAPDAIHTIAHELLHFIFFSFIEERFKNEIKHLSENQLWDLSEIFNFIVLRSMRYCEVIDKNFVHPYPSHIKYISQFEKIYGNSPSAEEFIINGISIIKTKK